LSERDRHEPYCAERTKLRHQLVIAVVTRGKFTAATKSVDYWTMADAILKAIPSD
jgi:hypothetical protein